MVSLQKPTIITGKMSKTLIFIQARMQSSRLPGKVLKKFSNNETILSLIVQQILQSQFFKRKDIVILTSINDIDKNIVEFAKYNKINFFCGDEKNVLKRFYEANKIYNSKFIIRVCADNPFLNPVYLDKLFLKKDGFDYVSFYTSENIPTIKTHIGLFAECFSKKALQTAYKNANDELDKEHVTSYFYNNKNLFKIKFCQIEESLEKSNIRLTVDDMTDFKNIDFILKHVDDIFDINKILETIEINENLKLNMSANIKKYEK